MLDISISAILQDIEHYKEVLQKNSKSPESLRDVKDSSEDKAGGSNTSTSSSNAGLWRKRILQKVQSALISSLEIGDEKLQIVQTMQDVVENKSRQLESDCKTLGKVFFYFH